MLYAVSITAFGLWAILKKKMGGGGGGGFGRGGGGGGFAAKLWFVPPLLLLIGSATLFETGIGGWLANAAATFLGWVGGFVGLSAALLAGSVGLLLLVATGLDLRDKKADGIAKAGLILLPMLAIIATGPVADAGSELFSEVSNLGTNGLNSVVGG